MMRCSGLKRLAVTHHGFNRIGMIRAGELFFLRLPAFDNGQRHEFFREPAIDAEHAERLLLGVFVRCVRRVTFLPQEFSCSQKQPRAHLPSHHVAPLINEQRQIAIGLDPVPI